MEKRSKDDRIMVIENRLDSIMQRLVKLERRLDLLERTKKQAKVIIKRRNSPHLAGLSSRGPTYIERVISSARREYNRER